MASKNPLTFQPDYAIKPGNTLEETLKTLCMKQSDLARRTGLSTKHINRIIRGKEAIVPDTALKLERALGVEASFWNNLESIYQERRSRLSEEKRLAPYAGWLNKFNVAAMIKMGWLKKMDSPIRQVSEVLNFFGVVNPTQWEKFWGSPKAAFRASSAFKKRPGDVAAWLRKGELEARNNPCKTFIATKFIGIQKKLRELTLETEPKKFIPELERQCAACGVAVVFVPELPGTGVFGATRWVSGHPIIQLSLRYKTNDHLWFTFFHEAGHILYHGRKMMFIEDGSAKSDKEEEANQYARDRLIPDGAYEVFVKAGQFDQGSVEVFSKAQKIAPGVVVGRLQHDEHLQYSELNGLKIRYEWASSN